MAAAINSFFEFINALPGVWQAGAYILLIALILGLFRVFPVICRVLWELTKVFLHAVLTYIWLGIRYILRPVFRPFAPLFRPVALLFWRLCNAMGIWSPAQRRAEGYRWIAGFGWYQEHPIWNLKRDRQYRQQAHEQRQRQEQAQAREQEQRQKQKQHEYKPQHDAPENPLQEACQFFNLPQDGNFNRATFQKKYLELMKAVHPDKLRQTKRAADEFSKRINAAKDLIKAAKGWK